MWVLNRPKEKMVMSLRTEVVFESPAQVSESCIEWSQTSIAKTCLTELRSETWSTERQNIWSEVSTLTAKSKQHNFPEGYDNT